MKVIMAEYATRSPEVIGLIKLNQPETRFVGDWIGELAPGVRPPFRFRIYIFDRNEVLPSMQGILVYMNEKSKTQWVGKVLL